MVATDFERLLQQAMGLDAATIGSSAVEGAVKMRQSVHEIDDVCIYWELVRTSAAELQALIEAVIVPETWFFRDREAFTALIRIANEDWLPTCAEGPMRLLSLPCSTGEEPYSMAMALIDGGFPLNRFRIDAVDISAQALTHARRAFYGKNSFRGNDLRFRDRHFEATALGSRLSDAARQYVHFQQGNMFAEDFLPGAEIYDSIFCRNMLIYFDRATQERALGVLRRLLKPRGVLFVGPSECGLLLSQDFVSTKVPLAFAFRRRGSVAQAVAPKPAPARPEVAPPPAACDSRAARSTKPAVVRQPNRPVEPPVPIEATQDEAFKLADQGRLDEAARSCEKHLREHGPSVQAFYLLGLIRAAAGDLAQAQQYYRKALYLDRNHYDTLVHFGLLLEKQGDNAGAQVLRDRLIRLQKSLAT